MTPLVPCPQTSCVSPLMEEGGEQVEEVFTAGDGQSKLGVLRAAGLAPVAQTVNNLPAMLETWV